MLQCDSFSTTDRITVLTIAENPVVLSIYQRGEKCKQSANARLLNCAQSYYLLFTENLFPREYLMIYRRLSFLAVVTFGSTTTPSPLSSANVSLSQSS
jgi:hypothetical protein